MSRHGYRDDLDQRDVAMWRGRVASAIRGKRGQRFLRDLIDALDTMPDKELYEGVLVTEDGACCALGAVGLFRKITGLFGFDTDDRETLGTTFDIATCLAMEVMYENDNCHFRSPAERWAYMRGWAARLLKPSVDRIGGRP